MFNRIKMPKTVEMSLNSSLDESTWTCSHSNTQPSAAHYIMRLCLSLYGHVTLRWHQHSDRNCSIWNSNYKLTSGSSSSNSSSNRCSSSSDSFFSSSSSSMSLYFSISFLITDMADNTPGNMDKRHFSTTCKRTQKVLGRKMLTLLGMKYH